jgi:ABC-type sugar transport system permease subunit
MADVAAVTETVEYLHALGHRRIAGVGGPGCEGRDHSGHLRRSQQAVGRREGHDDLTPMVASVTTADPTAPGPDRREPPRRRGPPPRHPRAHAVPVPGRAAGAHVHLPAVVNMFGDSLTTWDGLINGVAIGMIFLYFFQPGGTLDATLRLLGPGELSRRWLGDPGAVNYCLVGTSVWHDRRGQRERDVRRPDGYPGIQVPHVRTGLGDGGDPARARAGDHPDPAPAPARRGGVGEAVMRARLILGLFPVATLVPGVTTQVATFQIVNGLGLYNTRWAAVALFLGTGIISITIFLRFLRGIPRELDEPAALDGANAFTVFWRVILPQLKPAITTVVIVKGLAICNEYHIPFLYVPSRDLGVISTSLFRFKGPFGSQWEIISAGVVLVIIPTLVAFLALQRFSYNGFTAGSVK